MNYSVQDRLAAAVNSSEANAFAKNKWIHPFPARMPLSLASDLIKYFSNPGDVVLDPMCGSGTTLIAARTLGRSPVGVDADRLAVLISRCNCYGFQADQLNRVGSDIERIAWDIYRTQAYESSDLGLWEKEDNDFINFWFPTRSKIELSILSSVIDEFPQNIYADFSRVVLSGLVIAKHTSASYAMDLPRSRPHRCMDLNPISPLAQWGTRYAAASSRLPFCSQHPESEPKVFRGDARQLSIEDRSIDFVLTSPPYLNAIDYIRTSKFSLIWLGYTLKDLRAIRGRMIGTERGMWSPNGLPAATEAHLVKSIEIPRQLAIVRRYMSDIRCALMEIRRVLKPSKIAVLVLGASIVSKESDDTIDIISYIASAVGFETVGAIHRQIDARQRSLPTPDRSTGCPLSKRLRSEAIIVLRRL